jgi:hypothetical protein
MKVNFTFFFTDCFQKKGKEKSKMTKQELIEALRGKLKHERKKAIKEGRGYFHALNVDQ